MQTNCDPIIIEKTVRQKPVQITIHFQQDGPTPEACMTQVIAAHLKGTT